MLCGNCGLLILEPNKGYGISPQAICYCCVHDRKPITIRTNFVCNVGGGKTYPYWTSIEVRLPNPDEYPVLYYLPYMEGKFVIYPKLIGIQIPNNKGGFWQSILTPNE